MVVWSFLSLGQHSLAFYILDGSRNHIFLRAFPWWNAFVPANIFHVIKRLVDEVHTQSWFVINWTEVVYTSNYLISNEHLLYASSECIEEIYLAGFFNQWWVERDFYLIDCPAFLLFVFYFNLGKKQSLKDWWMLKNPLNIGSLLSSFSSTTGFKVKFCRTVVRNKNISIRARPSPRHARFPGSKNNFINWLLWRLTKENGNFYHTDFCSLPTKDGWDLEPAVFRSPIRMTGQEAPPWAIISRCKRAVT